jgi:hypothetical protein
MSNDTGILFPNREVKVGDETIIVRPFYFGELPVVVKLIFPILTSAGLSSMLKVVDDLENPGKLKVKMVVPENFVDILTYAILEATEPVIELLAFALKKERTWFNTISSDDGLLLTLAWFETNKDFFVQRVLPRIQHLLPKNSTGSTSSPSSSEPATEETISTSTQ